MKEQPPLFGDESDYIAKPKLPKKKYWHCVNYATNKHNTETKSSVEARRKWHADERRAAKGDSMNTEKVAQPDQKDSAKEQQQLKELAKTWPTLQAHAVELYEKDGKSAKELGNALIAVRDANKKLAKGKWGDWLKKHDIDRDRANYCIKVAGGPGDENKKDSKGDGKGDGKLAPAYVYQIVLGAKDNVDPLTLFEAIRKAAGEGNVEYVKNLISKLEAETETMLNTARSFEETAIQAAELAASENEAKQKREALMTKSFSQRVPKTAPDASVAA